MQTEEILYTEEYVREKGDYILMVQLKLYVTTINAYSFNGKQPYHFKRGPLQCVWGGRRCKCRPVDSKQCAVHTVIIELKLDMLIVLG